jgi:hypothetical protein
LVVSRKVNAGALAIPRRIQSQVQLPLACSNLNRDKKRFPEVRAIDSDGVNLIR